MNLDGGAGSKLFSSEAREVAERLPSSLTSGGATNVAISLVQNSNLAATDSALGRGHR